MIPNIEMRYIIQDLKRIRNLRDSEAKKLAEANYLTIYDIAKSNAISLSQDTGIVETRAKIIINSADAYLRPFGTWKSKLKLPRLEQLIFINIEYNRNINKLWMISLVHQGETAQFFVSNNTSELFLLEQIYSYLQRFQNTVLVCYSQSNFDFRILKSKANEHKFTSLLHLLKTRKCIDLGLELNKVFEPPKGSLKLKDLVRHFNIDSPYKHISNRKISDEYTDQLRKYGMLSKSYLKMVFELNVSKAKLLPRLLEMIDENIERI